MAMVMAPRADCRGSLSHSVGMLTAEWIRTWLGFLQIEWTKPTWRGNHPIAVKTIISTTSRDRRTVGPELQSAYFEEKEKHGHNSFLWYRKDTECITRKHVNLNFIARPSPT